MSEWWNEVAAEAARVQAQAKLVAMRTELDDAQREVQCLGQMNVANITPIAQVELDIRYRKAQDRLLKAYAAYQNGLVG